MYLFFGNVVAAASGQHDPQILLQLHQRLQLMYIQRDDSALAAVKLDEAFLFQQRIRLIHGMHVDAHRIRQLAHRREGFPLLNLGSRDPHDNLIPQLHIQRFVTVKVNLNNHIITSIFCYTQDSTNRTY